MNDNGRSHQQSQSPFLREIEFRADAAHSRRVSQISDILKAVVAGKVREIAIAREVGDSVLYHSLSGLASGHSGRLVHTATIRPLGCSRKMRPLAFLDPSAFSGTDSRKLVRLPTTSFLKAYGRR